MAKAGQGDAGADGEGLKAIPARGVEFVGEAWTELKKVHWPTRKETYQATGVVVVVVVVAAVFIGVVDFGISYLMRLILGVS